MAANTVKTFLAATLLLAYLFLPICSPAVQDETKTSPPAETTEEITLESVDKLMENKTVANSEKAIVQYKTLLANDPKNYEILYKLSNAYITIIDIKTNGLMEEKDEYKPLLKRMAKIANDYAVKACKLNPQSADAVASNLVSYGYYSAGFGIIKAIFKGAAGKYKDLCRRLIRLDKSYKGGMGYWSLGKLYHVAPWPVGSKSKALKNFKKALEIDNTGLYSHFYVGSIYFAKNKYDLAEKEFNLVVKSKPAQHEKHFFKAYVYKAYEYLDKIEKIKKDD